MTGPKTIIVADDEPDLQILFRQLFRKKIRGGEYTFHFAENGLEALELLIERPECSLLITDINMPIMDGLTLLENTRQLERELESIVITAYGDLTNIRTAMNRGAFDFLTKPIDLKDLEITVEKALTAVLAQRKAQQVRQMFGRYLSDDVVRSLIENPESVRLGGEKRVVTIMMSDLRGFSTSTESLPPEQVVEILNVYLGRMSEVIARYDGTIDEFIGDAILTLFGAPFQKENDAERAVACAIEMQQAMSSVNDSLSHLDLPLLEMGIGINTGEVVVGNIGSDIRTKYGVVGSNVNLTSRIESYSVGGQVLISEETRSAVPAELETSRPMEVGMKGFADPVRLFEITGIGSPYNLSLTRTTETPEPLINLLEVDVSVLDGKNLLGIPSKAVISSLANATAVITSHIDVQELDNLKITLYSPQKEGERLGDCYGKVISIPNPGTLMVRFTAVPIDVGTFLASLPRK